MVLQDDAFWANTEHILQLFSRLKTGFQILFNNSYLLAISIWFSPGVTNKLFLQPQFKCLRHLRFYELKDQFPTRNVDKKMACISKVTFILPGWGRELRLCDLLGFGSFCRQEQRGTGCDRLRPPCVPGAQPLPSLQIPPLRGGPALQPAVHPAERLHQAPRCLPLSQVASFCHRAFIRHHPAGPVPGTDPANAAGWIHQCKDTSDDVRFVLPQLGGCFVLRGEAARELQGPSEAGRVGFCLPEHQQRCRRHRTWLLWFSHRLLTPVCGLP